VALLEFGAKRTQPARRKLPITGNFVV